MPRRTTAAAQTAPSVTATFTMPPAAPPAEPAPDETKPDFWDYIHQLTPEKWKDHIIYVTRENPKTSINGIGGYLVKMQQAFDIEDIRQAYGGYEFSYILKEGSDICKKCRNATGRFRIEAPPRYDATREASGNPPSNGHSASGGNDALLKILEEQIRAMREEISAMRSNGQSAGQDRTIDLMAKGAETAMQIVKDQMPKTTSASSEMREMVTAMKEMGIIGSATHQKSIVEQLVEAVTNPIIGPKLLELLTPKNPLDELIKLKGVKELLDGLGGGGGGGKGDWKTALVEEGVPAVRDLVTVLAERRKAELETTREGRLRAEANARTAETARQLNEQRQRDARNGTPPPAAAAASASSPNAPVSTGAPVAPTTFRVVPMNGEQHIEAVPPDQVPADAIVANADEFLKGVKVRFVELLASDKDSEFIVDFLEAAWPQSIEYLRKFSAQQVSGYFQNDPVLGRVVGSPAWNEWLEDAQKYLTETAEQPEPVGARRPN